MARNVLFEIATGRVVNVVEVGAVSAWRPPAGHAIAQTNRGDIGDIFNPATGTFTTPVRPPTRTQYLLAHDVTRAHLDHAILTNDAAELLRLRTEYAAANALEPGVIGIP